MGSGDRLACSFMTSTQEVPNRIAQVGPYGIPLDTIHAIRKITDDVYWGRLAASVGAFGVCGRMSTTLGPAKVAILSALMGRIDRGTQDVTLGIAQLSQRTGQAQTTTAAHLRRLTTLGVVLRVVGSRGSARYTLNPTAFGIGS